MDEIASMEELLKVAALSAPIAWFVTEVGKNVIRKRGEPTEFWWDWGLRIVSVVAGSCSGYLLMESAVGILAGSTGGILSSTIVYTLKKYIRGLVREGDE